MVLVDAQGYVQFLNVIWVCFAIRISNSLDTIVGGEIQRTTIFDQNFHTELSLQDHLS